MFWRFQSTVDRIKEASVLYGYTMAWGNKGLEKEIMQGTMPGARRRGRPHTAWMDMVSEDWRLHGCTFSIYFLIYSLRQRAAHNAYNYKDMTKT